MKVSNSQYTKKYIKFTAFKGIPVGKVLLKGTQISDEITLYSINKKDVPFLLKMFKKINLEKLYPHINDKTGFDDWKTIIFQAIEDINLDYKGLLAVRRNKPCGIMSYNVTEMKDGSCVEHFASWPIKKEEGTKGSGRALIRSYFEQIAGLNKKHAFLVHSRITPRYKSCEDFYKFAGFKNTPFGNIMEIKSEPDIETNIFSIACKHLDDYMQYKPVINKTDKDLDSILNLGYE